ncbi:succinoglycan biosynthesis transport protein ExoP [Pedobacter sp. UYP30]|uniref:exopolysaccharide transport family protein n=1 Tax=Pedobacter sp. UYP30 TaxID=1756400 RepID=UPI00339461D3
MDIKAFFKFLGRYKWYVLLIPIVAVVITYFAVQNLPNQYSSEASIATGLLDPSKQIISDQTVDFFQVSQQFKNIMDKLQMKRTIDILSYNLIIHDLQNPKTAFKKPSKQLDSLSAAQKTEVAGIFREKLLKKDILTTTDNKGKYRLFDIVQSMGYDQESLQKNLSITHQDISDFIDIDYKSENPNLSVFVVNNLATEFIGNYGEDVLTNQNTSLALLDSMVKKKEVVMNEKNNALADFKRSKGVLNLSEQSATVFAQITNYESERAETLKKIQSSLGALSVINAKLKGGDVYVDGSTRSDNREIVALKKKLQSANERFIDNGFKIADQKSIDSLTKLISAKSNQSVDNNAYDPTTSRQALVQQRTSLQIEIQQAKSSMSSINNELASLRGKYSSMVPYDADIQNYERDAELATKDYTGALDRYNKNITEQRTGLKLQIAEMGLVGNPLPSKKILFLAGAGLGSFFLTIAIFFGIFITDHSIKTGRMLELATKSPTLGSINLIDGDERIPRNIWTDKSNNKGYDLYRDHLRSIRFDILNKMDADDSKILGVTSLANNAGKTFLSYSLAYAFAMTGKKILLIAEDQPFEASKDKTLSTSTSFQSFLVKKEFHTDDLITVMNKSAERNSLLEVQNIASLRAGFDVLRNEFDIIIIDINSLTDVNIAKEWLLFTEKNIGVFEYGTSVTEHEYPHIKYIKNQPGFLGWVLNKVDHSKTA